MLYINIKITVKTPSTTTINNMKSKPACVTTSGKKPKPDLQRRPKFVNRIKAHLLAVECKSKLHITSFFETFHSEIIEHELTMDEWSNIKHCLEKKIRAKDMVTEFEYQLANNTGYVKDE